MYITRSQLSERPGARELAEVATAAHQQLIDSDLMAASLAGTDRSAWSVDEIAIADEALQRIDAAVVDAQSLIDGFLAQRGYLPLDPVPGIVTTWARAITRYKLHQDRISDDKDPIVRDYKDALKLLQLTADGKFSLGADDPIKNSPSAIDLQFESDEKVFSREQLTRFR
jgi:phage gp36-like protein